MPNSVVFSFILFFLPHMLCQSIPLGLPENGPDLITGLVAEGHSLNAEEYSLNAEGHSLNAEGYNLNANNAAALELSSTWY